VTSSPQRLDLSGFHAGARSANLLHLKPFNFSYTLGISANNLFTLRQVIDEYTYDKKKAPQSLQDLVAAGYLQNIPIDPITNSSDTWHTINEDALQAVDQTEPGIFDVKSGSDKTGLDGTPYADW